MKVLVSAGLCLISLWSVGCSAPPDPPEVKEAEIQNSSLRGAGSAIHAPADYKRYTAAYRKAKFKFLKEKAKFTWSRNYKPVAAEFRNLLKEGERIQEKVREQKEAKTAQFFPLYSDMKKKLNVLNTLTLRLNEGRLARGDLVKAELLLEDAKRAHETDHYKEANNKLEQGDTHLRKALGTLDNVLKRYKDKSQVAQWLKWAADTLYESRRKGIPAIIVNKIDRQLILYRKGIPVKTYKTGLGRNGLNNKLHAGDNATPEGRYHIVKKNYFSKYYKALLPDYPNEDDRRQFYLARKKGIIPAKIGIGGAIEIHGGEWNL